MAGRVSRRAFVSGAGAGAAVLGAGVGKASAQLIYMPADWHGAEFDKLVKSRARLRQVFDATSIVEGGPLLPMMNSINGLQFGYGVAADQIKVVAALRGRANLMNFDDSMWAKYRLGEYTKTDDPRTKAAAVRNIFYPKMGYSSTDPKAKESVYQDWSIEALRARGLQMLSCHNATMHQAVGIVKQFGLTATPDEVTADLQAHMLPGTIAVPAMVAAVAMLQCEGKFAYTMG